MTVVRDISEVIHTLWEAGKKIAVVVGFSRLLSCGIILSGELGALKLTYLLMIDAACHTSLFYY